MRYILLSLSLFFVTMPVFAGEVIDAKSIAEAVQQGQTAMSDIQSQDLENKYLDIKEKIAGNPVQNKVPISEPKVALKSEDVAPLTSSSELRSALEKKEIDLNRVHEIVKENYRIDENTYYTSEQTPLNAQVTPDIFYRIQTGQPTSDVTVSVNVDKNANVARSTEAMEQQGHVLSETARAVAQASIDKIKTKSDAEFNDLKSGLAKANNVDSIKKNITKIETHLNVTLNEIGVIRNNALAVRSMDVISNLRTQ